MEILKNSRLNIILILLLAFIAYSNTFRNGFVYDDEFFVEKNESIRSLGSIPRFFVDGNTAVRGGGIEGDVYRPLTTLSYCLDYSLWKLNPAGYHLTNLVFHALNGVLVYLLMKLLFADAAFSLLTALLFTVHPIQTDAVTWVSGRSNVLFLFFYLLALYFYRYPAKQGVKTFRVMSVCAFVLALLSKEMALTLPLVIVLYDYYFRPREGKFAAGYLKRYFPYFLACFLFVLLRAAVLGKVAQKQYWGGGLYPTMLTMSRVTVDYIKLLFYPLKLCADYVYPVSFSFFEPGVLTAFCILALLFAAVFIAFRKERRISFALAWFFITLLPVSNLIPLKILLAERFLYLPSIGFCIIVSVIITRTYADARINRLLTRGLRIAFALILLASYTARTAARNRDWKDGLTFWSGVVKSSPLNSKAHNNLASYYRNAGMIDRAEEECKLAISIKQDYVTPHFNLAAIYLEKKMYEEALKEFDTVLMLKPDFPNALKYRDQLSNYLKNKRK
jgi:protein O-mannosyl-transferase